MGLAEAGTVDIWFGERLEDTALETSIPALNAAERARAARFTVSGPRTEYLSAHILLRRVLARYLDCAPAEVDIVEGENGKPLLKDGSLWFNLSHSHGLAAVAVTRHGPVGIDIEQIRDVPEQDGIAARYFPPGEPGSFFERWTRLEALVKACGCGLGAAPGKWWAANVTAPPGYAAAVSVERGPVRIRYQKL